MDNTGDLRLLLASRHPLIVAEAREEGRFLGILRQEASALGLPVWTWSMARGLMRDGMGPIGSTLEAPRALQFLADNTTPGVFVFCDIHHALSDPGVLRRIKELAQAARPGQTIVLAAPRIEVPPDIEGLALPWRLEPPDRAELQRLVERTLADLGRSLPVRLSPTEVASLVDALRGLSLGEAERLIQQAALRDGAVDVSDVAFVSRRKAALIERGGALELVESEIGTLDDVGGLDALKEWLALRGRALEPEAREFGLDPPRGALVTGVPGCGKSLAAKTLARTWGMPLLLFDASKLYGSYIGESEGRLHDALEAAAAMAPAVLWIDEIEKGFSSGGQGDGGVSRRILGAFLRWMQERPPGVFLIATANDVTALPPELLRKGRFDEIFFVDLPVPEEREAVFRIHLTRRRRDPAAFDLAELVAASEGFSGAEIEAAVVGGLYRSYGQGRDLDTGTILDELHATVPLSQARAEDIAALRRWADGRAVPATRRAAHASA